MISEAKAKELDGHWEEVMNLAEKYGFILSAYGGSAILATHRNQIDVYDEEKYIFRQHSMFGIDMRGKDE